jgi:hypothetical protein
MAVKMAEMADRKIKDDSKMAGTVDRKVKDYSKNCWEGRLKGQRWR